MSNLKEIEEDETVKKMLNSRSLEPQTKANYCKAIADFCSFFNAKPSEIVEQFKSMSEEEIVSKFADYFADAKDRLAPKSVWGWLPGIKAWLLENGVRQIDRVSREIAREFRRKLGSPKPMLKRDILTSEEIVKILEKADLREKAIITTIASGGFRLSTALKLKLKHIKDDIETNLPCYMVEVPEELTKEDEPYVTFISSEARDYIKDYLMLRKGRGEEITPESYLFVTDRGAKPLSDKRFENIWRRLCEEAKIDTKPITIKGKHATGKRNGQIIYEEKPRRYNTRIHALRKYFKTACSVSGVDRMASETFLGHSLTKFGMESIYDFAISKKDWLRQQYLKALPALTFLKKVNFKEIEDIRDLQARLAEAYVTIEKLKAQLRQSITLPELLEIFKGTIPPEAYKRLENKAKQVTSGKISEF